MKKYKEFMEWLKKNNITKINNSSSKILKKIIATKTNIQINDKKLIDMCYTRINERKIL